MSSTAEETPKADPAAKVADLVERCRALHDDLTFEAARTWKEAEPGRRVIGYLPTYVPREVIHAAGFLPLGVIGGGDALEIIKGDAYFQSYICHIPRSVVELGVTGRLDFLDGMLFPSICDVIRNLSGMWQMLFPKVWVHYLDVPQNYEEEVGGAWWGHEIKTISKALEELGGAPFDAGRLSASIAVYNRNRALVHALYDLRARAPHKVTATEAYLLTHAGLLLPVEEHTALLEEYLPAAEALDRPQLDNSRVIVRGAFCEQPPLVMIRTLERAGCDIVDDDFLLVTLWFSKPVPEDGDPVEALALAYLRDGVKTSARYENEADGKSCDIEEQVKRRAADGIIFAAPSFCDPALLDRPLLQNAAERCGIPSTSFKYAENTGQMAPIREQAGTFSDSIKLWSV